jgi:predicted phage terminase large subunit-like protein
VDQQTLQQVMQLPLEQQREILALTKKIEQAGAMDAARGSFMGYINHMWPRFIEGRHHRIMANAFDRIIDGSLKRLIINMGPRHTKSEFASKFLPSKYLGHYPDRFVIQASHNAELAHDFGRDTRNIVNTDKYRQLFPNTELQADTKAAGRWNTTEGGKYFAIGVGGKLAGKGADLFIIDDPHSEQDYIRSLGGDTSVFKDAYQWYQTGPRQRLQPGAAIVIVMTRWHAADLTGKLIKRMTENPGVEDWEIIEFPAFLPPESEKPLWPEFWSKEELLATKESLSPAQWAAQYLQHPTMEGAALVKREWWKRWEHKDPPECEFIIQSWDTAFTAKQTSDYSARTDWGVFYMEDDEGLQQPNLILLGAKRERLEFPDLKREAFKQYQRRKPDAFVVEAKASGLPLIYELRQMGIPVSEFTPSRGNDKVVRVNAVADLFRSGVVWCPETRWAEEVIEEFAAFPAGEHDDYVDSSTQALLRFRQGGFVSVDTDEDEEEWYPHRKADYY